ncbi:MAG TPA: hypothetical protein HA359_05850 [Candidatus Poseidoniaceae archaeon]|nr:MAG TPA: hypothetical protein D7H84_05845 [Candidatus Poseidoniales archaeon]HII23761.1 hypothetical protein [Candidatus Poseidoniaceae archaeon]
MEDEISSKQITIDELDDVELNILFKTAVRELAKRKLDEHNFIFRVEQKLYRIECEITELNSADDFDDDDDWEDDDYWEDDDDWYDYDSNTRTPNDDRSDSMNPNSHRYNP